MAFTGSTEVGQQIMQYATQNIIPVTLELGGKSPNIFFADVMDEEDAFFDKALEGFALFAFNQGEVCTCPSRALVQESIYERFMERAIRRVESIRSGNPLDNVTQMGAQVSYGQLETILNYIDIGKKEGADVLTGGRRKVLGGDLQEGYYLEPTILFGKNNMRVFQEEIFGPVLAVTTFKTMDEALELANDTQYGLGRASGAVTVTLPIKWAAAFRPDAYGQTAITPIRLMRRLAATNSRASGAKPIK